MGALFRRPRGANGLLEDLTQKEREKYATVQGDRFPMPDKKHARLALAMIDRAHGLSDDDKAKIRARAHAMLGTGDKKEAASRMISVVSLPRKIQVVPKDRMSEADRGVGGKFTNDRHTAHAREHILAASIALNGNDTDEAKRRIASAQLHASHSQHRSAGAAVTKLGECMECVESDPEKCAGKLDEAYTLLQGEKNHLLQVKRTRESDPSRPCIETLTFHPRFLENSLDVERRTVDVIIISEGLGNSRDRHFYTEQALREAVRDRVFNPAQAYADHPSKFDDANRPERSVRDLIGYFFDTKLVETVDKKSGKPVKAIAAKLRIQAGADWALDLIREAIDFAKKFPDQAYVGISINADGDTVPGERDGVQCNQVVKITEAFSADMVTKPARGGGFLRLVEGAAAPLQHKGALTMKPDEAAAKLRKLAEAKEVSPSDLTEIADAMKGFREASKSDEPEGMTEAEREAYAKMDESQRESFKKTKMAEAKGKQGVGDNDADNNGGKGDGDGDEPNCAESKKKREAAQAAVKTLREANLPVPAELLEAAKEPEVDFVALEKQYPTLIAAAIRESERRNGAPSGETAQQKSDREELVRLRAEKGLRESHDLAKRLLRESNIPTAGWPKVISDIIGLSADEMQTEIKNTEKFYESLGIRVSGKETGGAGASSIPLRESDVKSNTAALLNGVCED